MLTHPSGPYSAYQNSALRGCWPLIFLHALDTDPRLLAHTPNWGGGPLKISRANIKNLA